MVVLVANAEKARVATSPKYQLALADLDNTALNLLPLQVRMGDYIRPGEYWGPNTVMDIAGVKRMVKVGDRVFGYATVRCPDCIKTRIYIVYLKHGVSGWYSEVSGLPEDAGNMSFFKRVAAATEDELNRLVPQSKRVPIR